MGCTTPSRVGHKQNGRVLCRFTYYSPRVGIFTLADKITRQLPTVTDNVTHETIHPSVLNQAHVLPQLKTDIDNNPALVCGLLPAEEDLRKNWPFVPGKYPPKDYKTTEQPEDALHKSLVNMAIHKGTQLSQHALHEITHSDLIKNASGSTVSEKNWIGRHASETPFGNMLEHWAEKK